MRVYLMEWNEVALKSGSTGDGNAPNLTDKPSLNGQPKVCIDLTGQACIMKNKEQKGRHIKQPSRH